jgi:DNA modification methylase
MLTSSRVKTYFNDLGVNSILAFSNITKGQNQRLTHAYHRYPAKFIPTLASYLINKNSNPGDLVCDPFGGCGTTLVEAKINGRRSIGIDINPLASLISKTKITAIDPQELEDETNKLLLLINKPRLVHELTKEKLNYWFDKKTLGDLQRIYEVILESSSAEIQRFFLCAFSHILKNCSRWLMKSIKPTIDKTKEPIDANLIFTKHLSFMKGKNFEYHQTLLKSNNKSTQSKFYLRDARNTGLPDDSIDYILTSPPYVTSYEYADLHQLSLLWFENIDNWIEFKKKFIGTSHRGDKNKNLHSNIGDNVVRLLDMQDHSLARSVRTYYEDMYDFLLESRRLLKRGKKMSMVIGNTTLRGVNILNAEVAFEQMQSLGFTNLCVDKRMTSSQSITPFRDIKTGQFTSVKNHHKRRAYQYEYVLGGKKA